MDKMVQVTTVHVGVVLTPSPDNKLGGSHQSIARCHGGIVAATEDHGPMGTRGEGHECITAAGIKITVAGTETPGISILVIRNLTTHITTQCMIFPNICTKVI